jgi:hypothetical protein
MSKVQYDRPIRNLQIQATVSNSLFLLLHYLVLFFCFLNQPLWLLTEDKLILVSILAIVPGIGIGQCIGGLISIWLFW